MQGRLRKVKQYIHEYIHEYIQVPEIICLHVYVQMGQIIGRKDVDSNLEMALGGGPFLCHHPFSQIFFTTGSMRSLQSTEFAQVMKLLQALVLAPLVHRYQPLPEGMLPSNTVSRA